MTEGEQGGAGEKKPCPPPSFFHFENQETGHMEKTYTKPEAMGIIQEALEHAGLAQPIKPYSITEYNELTRPTDQTDQTDRTADRSQTPDTLHLYTPDTIRDLQEATGEALTDSALIFDLDIIREETPDHIRG